MTQNRTKKLTTILTQNASPTTENKSFLTTGMDPFHNLQSQNIFLCNKSDISKL